MAIAPACTDIVTCALRVLTSSAIAACADSAEQKSRVAARHVATAKVISIWTTCLDRRFRADGAVLAADKDEVRRNFEIFVAIRQIASEHDGVAKATNNGFRSLLPTSG